MAADCPTPSAFGFAVVGSEMAGFTVAGVLIDWAAGTTPWAIVGLTVLGCVVAFVHLFQMMKAPAGPAP